MSPTKTAEVATKQIHVLIVDDHTLVRSGLRLLLEAEPDVTVDDEAGDAEQAIRLARLHKPDVILLDVVMPGRSGLDAVPEILEAAPKAKILVLSMQDDPSYVRQAFSAGATGYLLKEAADDELVQAVREVAGGGRYVHPALGARLAAAEAEARARAEADPLSEREREVLRLLALGHTNQEIAKLLFISVRTAETHRAHVMQKLRLSTRAELVRHALQQGLLEPDGEPAPSSRPARLYRIPERVQLPMWAARPAPIIQTCRVTPSCGANRCASSRRGSSSSCPRASASKARTAGARLRPSRLLRRHRGRADRPSRGERLCGKPAVVVDLEEGGPLRIGSVDGVGTVSELADELTRLSGH